MKQPLFEPIALEDEENVHATQESFALTAHEKSNVGAAIGDYRYSDTDIPKPIYDGDEPA